MKTNKEYTTEFRQYGLVTVPAGTKVTNSTANGIDKTYHFVNEFSWIAAAYPDYANILEIDMHSYGLNVPAEFVEKELSDERPDIVVNVEHPIDTKYCGYEIKPCKTYADKDGINVERCEPEEAEFWSIDGLEHQEDGSHLPMNVADCATQEIAFHHALNYATKLSLIKRIGGFKHE